MLERFLKEEEHAIVLFYDEEKRNGRAMHDILKSLEAVDDKLDKVLCLIHRLYKMLIIKLHILCVCVCVINDQLPCSSTNRILCL